MTGSPARRRDRRVYTASHPVLYRALTATRGRPVLRIGSRVVVNDEAMLRRLLTEVPLDRTAPGTTGGAILANEGSEALFDESGPEHRAARRRLMQRLGGAAVTELRPVWQPVLDVLGRRLREGGPVDLCPVADELSGRTAAALLNRTDIDPATLARAARRTASEAATQEISPWRGHGFAVFAGRRRSPGRHLDAVLGGRDPLATMLTLATVSTTFATLPRAAAWVAGADLWDAAADPRQREVLVAELLRVLAPTPLLPRAPAVPAELDGHRIVPGDRLALMLRHAVTADRPEPSVHDPAPARTSRLVFGAGAHACPGAALATAQLGDLLAVLAPCRPVVVRAVPDRRAALPAWRSLVLCGSVCSPPAGP